MSVLVVGGGLAGLVAAQGISQRGLDVTLLEARDRVGGRVWSHRFPNGAVVELGGEWIAASQQAVVGLASELGLSLIDTGQEFSVRDLIGEPPIPEESHRRLSAALARAFGETTPASLEQMTAASILDRIGDEGPAKSVLRSRLEGTFAVPLSEVAAAELDGEFGLGEESRYLRVAGGNDLLAIELAARLDVRLGVAVESVAHRSDGVLLGTSSGSFGADCVVLAVPLPILREPGFLVGPPRRLVDSMAMIGMGTAVKVASPTLGAPPMCRRQDRDIPGWYWTGAGPDGDTRHAVTGFAGTSKGASILATAPEDRLASAVPEVALTGPIVIADWGADRWARGCYSAIGPGRRQHLEAMQESWDGIVFAGEHVNGTGTIDGAIRSGRSAAGRVIEFLGRP